jgi:hypothetical protein
VTDLDPIEAKKPASLAFEDRVGDYSIMRDVPLIEFLKALLKNDPWVVFFGELHKAEPETYESTMERFAEQILPRMAKAGYRDLIFEFIPDDPVVEREIENFYKTGILNEEVAPNLLMNVTIFDYCTIIDVLTAARELGIRVHGAYLSLSEIPKTIESDEYDTSEEMRDYTAALIVGHETRRIDELRAGGRKFMIYGGLAHNDLRATETGEYLDRLYGNRYFEVDLIVPEALAHLPADERPYVAPLNWRKLIPTRGVTVLRHANSYYLFFPRSCGVQTINIFDLFICPVTHASQCS